MRLVYTEKGVQIKREMKREQNLTSNDKEPMSSRLNPPSN